MLKGKMLLGIVVCMAVGLNLACSFGDQTGEANKLIDEANSVIKTNNEKIIKSSTLTNELLGGNLASAEDIDEYKTTNKAKFDELVSLSDQIEKSDAEIVEKFEQASKMKLDETYKKYLEAKTAEFKKRGEGNKLTAPLVKAFLQTKDVDAVNKQIEDYNKKFSANVKESDELMKKADQIAKENPNSIK